LATVFLMGLATGLGLLRAGLGAGFAFAGFLAGAAGFRAAGLAAFFAIFLVATRMILSFLETQRRRVIA
jgi:hypothetical protein